MRGILELIGYKDCGVYEFRYTGAGPGEDIVLSHSVLVSGAYCDIREIVKEAETVLQKRFDLYREGRGPSCGCGRGDLQEDHPCPFKQEINDDDNNFCQCCNHCQADCVEAT